MLLRDIWDLINLGQFDPINPKIPLIMIPLSNATPSVALNLRINGLASHYAKSK